MSTLDGHTSPSEESFMDVGPVRTNYLHSSIAQQLEPLVRQPEKREIIEAVKAVNKADLFGQENELTFVLDRKSQKVIVRIVNKETGELVRQIPDDYVRRLASDLIQE